MPESTPRQKYTQGKLYQIPVNEIIPDPGQPRKYFDPEALEQLKASIQKSGILQPILVNQMETGQVQVVAGERRFRAARETGLATVPAILVTGNTSEISLIENLIRENLTAIEEAEALQRMIEAHKYTQEALGRLIGKAAPTVSEILSLNKLPDEIRDECRNNPKASRRVLLEIVGKPTSKGMKSLYEKYKREGKLDGAYKRRERKKRTRRTDSPAEQIVQENAVSGRDGRVSVVEILEGFKKAIDETDFSELIEQMEVDEKSRAADLYRDFLRALKEKLGNLGG